MVYQTKLLGSVGQQIAPQQNTAIAGIAEQAQIVSSAAANVQRQHLIAQAQLDEQIKRQQEVNENAATNAAQLMQVQAQQIANTLSEIKGSQAINFDFERESTKLYHKALEEVTKGLNTDEQRRMFDKANLSIEQALQSKLAKHKADQIDAYDRELLSSNIQLGVRSIALATDENIRTQNIARTEQYIDRLAQKQGWTAERTQLEKIKIMGDNLSLIANEKMKSGNINDVDDFVRRYGSYMDVKQISETRIFINEEIEKQSEEINAKIIADALGGSATISVPNVGSGGYTGALKYDYTPRDPAARATFGKRDAYAKQTFELLKRGGEASDNIVMIARAAERAGFTKEQASVIAGNIYREHGATTAGIRGQAVHSDGANKKLNYGMINWQGARAKAYQDFMRKKGYNPTSLPKGEVGIQAQLEFMRYEMTQGTERKSGSAFINSKTPQEAQRTFRNYIRWDSDGNVLLKGNTYKHAGKMDAATEFAYLSIGGRVSSKNVTVTIDTSSEEAIRTSARAGGLSTKQIEGLVKSYKTVQSSREAEKKEREDAVKGSAVEALLANGGNYDALPPSIRAQVRGTLGLKGEEELRQYGHTSQQNAESQLAYKHVNEIAALYADEEKLKKMTPAQFLSLIPKYGRKEVANLQKAQVRAHNREQTGLRAEKEPTRLEMLIAQDAIKASGADQNKVLKGDVAVYAKYNLQQSLNAAAEKLGRNLTDAERANIIRTSSSANVYTTRLWGLNEDYTPAITQKPFE